MGLLKKVFGGVKKVFSSVGRAVKKVVSGVVKVGKKIVKGIGKVMGKLGPIGTLAIAFIAPYAISALAGMGGTIGAVATKIQSVMSAVAAPFKAVGAKIGAGIQTAGAKIGAAVGSNISQALGTGITNLSNKIGTFLGAASKTGNITEGATSMFGDLAKAPINSSYKLPATLQSTPGVESLIGETLSASAPSSLAAAPAVPYSEALGSSLLSVPKPTILGTALPTAVGAPPFKQGLVEEAISAPATPPKTSLLDRGTDLAKKALSSFSGTPTGKASSLEMPSFDTSGYDPLVSAAGGYDPSGGTGRSFYAQDRTGLLATEEFVRNASGLLSRRAA